MTYGRWATTARIVLLAATSMVILVPLVLMLLTPFKTQLESFSAPLSLPEHWSFHSFRVAIQTGSILQRGINSIVITVTAVFAGTSMGALAGYSIARMRARALRGVLLAVFVLGLVLPLQAGMIPLFKEIQWLGLSESRVGLISIYTAMTLPGSVIMFANFFREVPIAIEEAAALDGAGALRLLITIVLPLSRPIVATVVIFNAVFVWNDYFVALVFTLNPDNQTLPLGLSHFHSPYGVTWPELFAYSTIVAAPLIVVYIFLQRYIIAGLTAGAVRG